VLYGLLWVSGRQHFVCIYYYYLNLEYKLFIRFPEWATSQENGYMSYKEICLYVSRHNYCNRTLSDS